MRNPDDESKPDPAPRNQKPTAQGKTRTYKQAGVDIEAGNEVVRRVKDLARGTFSSRVITDIGGFSGLYSFNAARLHATCPGLLRGRSG